MHDRPLSLLAASLLALGVATPTGLGQLGPDQAQQIREAIPDARFFESGDVLTAVYGTTLSTGATPEQSARSFVFAWRGLFAEDIGDLVLRAGPDGQTVLSLMRDPATGDFRFHTFRLHQEYRGIPVFRKGLGFLTRNEPGHPVVLSSFDVAELQGVDLRFPASAAGLNDAVRGQLREHLDSEADAPMRLLPMDIRDEEFVVWAGTAEAPVAPRAAVSFVVQRGSRQNMPFYEKYLVVADLITGDILLSETQIHNCSTDPMVDVVGSVKGNATDGLRSLDCDPTSTFALPWAEVSVLGGNTAYADADGLFSIPHAGGSAVTVRSRLRGLYFEVFDESAGGSIPQIDLGVTPPGPADFLHNPSSTQFSTANVNTYLEANLIRDWALSFEPSFPTIATQQFFNCYTNINSSCNAFYDGSSINFYRQAGGCANTAMADVVYHEYGHHLINVTGNGQGQLGEGTGDTVAVLIQDDPILAPGFTGNCNSGIRTANNNHQYPCNGAIHDCGQLISGCVWDTRNELIVTEPANYRDINSALFLGMLIARGQQRPGNSTIDPFITILYLTLDDNDADIGNGTPHYQEIANGFGAHNMDAPPLDLLGFDYPGGRPELISPTGGVEFTVVVSGISGAPISGTGVLYVDRGAGFEAFPMNETSQHVYEASFPESTCGSQVRYYVAADALGGSTDQDPDGAPDDAFTALSGTGVSTLWADDFETATGWSVSGNASDGQWNRGVPVGGGDRGDPPADADGSGSCYLTDNVDGNSDVDGGSTILTSPVLDASGTCNPQISYWRWFHNSGGNAPFEDTMVVELSNDGGGSWTVLETVGPTGPEVSGGWFQKTFAIADFLAPTDQMRLRFTASDLFDGSVVEAGVDGVVLQDVECGDVLCLSAAPTVVQGGDTLSVAVHGGDAGRPVLLYTWDVDGIPFMRIVWRSSFDGTGSWEQDFTVPNGVPPATVGLRAIGGALGSVHLSNISTVTLQ